MAVYEMDNHYLLNDALNGYQEALDDRDEPWPLNEAAVKVLRLMEAAMQYADSECASPDKRVSESVADLLAGMLYVQRTEMSPPTQMDRDEEWNLQVCREALHAAINKAYCMECKAVLGPLTSDNLEWQFCETCDPDNDEEDDND